MTAGKKAAAVSAERRSTYLFRVLVVFIIGAVRVLNDNIVELEAAWFEVCRRPVPRSSRRRARVRIKKPGDNQMRETKSATVEDASGGGPVTDKWTVHYRGVT